MGDGWLLISTFLLLTYSFFASQGCRVICTLTSSFPILSQNCRFILFLLFMTHSSLEPNCQHDHSKPAFHPSLPLQHGTAEHLSLLRKAQKTNPLRWSTQIWEDSAWGLDKPPGKWNKAETDGEWSGARMGVLWRQTNIYKAWTQTYLMPWRPKLPCSPQCLRCVIDKHICAIDP